MKITNIQKSGTSSTLRWAIANGADIKQDIALQSIINNEMFFTVTIEDVSFFERFLLIQYFRDMVRTMSTSFKEPSRNEIRTWFHPVEKTPNGVDMFYDTVMKAVSAFNNLSLQMKADDDIIDESYRAMFSPMICSRYTVQIPMSFFDIIGVIPVEKAAAIFNTDYPATLSELVRTDEVIYFISAEYAKRTTPMTYSKKLESYINAMKYAPIANNPNSDNTDIYRCGLLSFYKDDPVTKDIVRCNLIPAPPKEELEEISKRLNRIDAPLCAEFVIQAPIFVMSGLMNTFSELLIPVKYTSSVTNIIQNGITFDSFNRHTATVEGEAAVEAINNYRIRIAEATETSLKSITDLVAASKNYDDYFIDLPMAYALLPSIFNTRAVITLDSSKRAAIDEIVKSRSFNYGPGYAILRDAWTLMNRLQVNIAKFA